MSRRTHHRSRSSIDRVLDLLGDLDESQMEALLQEAESTVSSNIPVAKGIDFFDGPTQAQPARRKFLTTLSPRKQTELRRRISKRKATAQERATGDTLANAKKTPRSYKRISRPFFSLPSQPSTPDLCDMLAAYLLDASVPLASSPSSVASGSTLSTPITPRSTFSSISQSEPDTPGLDLLEPEAALPPRTHDIFGNPMKEPSWNISGIFEVLGDAGAPGGAHYFG
ncbi:hypothetical protein F5X99DRAFT_384472 [Biscogniauxia marginata]|nr:hypothetical protein F5X99DRAFT_384472 [Biscogniauxia marginata]